MAGDDLARLAAAHGVMTHYDNWADERVDVPAATVVATLAALGVDAGSDAAVRRSLALATDAPWRQLLPPTVVVTPRRRTASVRVPAGAAPTLHIELEDGTSRPVAVAETRAVERRDVGGDRVERLDIPMPDDLPLGYHRLVARAGERSGAAHLVVAPAACPTRRELGRVWGWMVQLYGVRSQRSWGIGDYADLAELGRWSGRTGADFLLCNPLHAAAPTLPQVDSPYSPASRRFHNAAHLRVTEIPEVALLDAGARSRLDRLAAAAAAMNRSALVDRDTATRLQREALELVHAVPLGDRRAAALAAYREREGAGLVDFATWCALAERHGADWREWPAELRHPRSPGVATARDELRAVVDFHIWLQWLCDSQLAAAQRAAIEGGQRIGVIHDLAVGVAPGGADAWALQDEMALDVSVGAPPDSFNQQGQDWALPPLRPDRLAETGYAAVRDMLRSVLRHAGGLRVDHAVGLFRLYWIAEGCTPAEGTYVRYPVEDLLAIVAVEAHRAQAVVVAEDLGTVEDGVPEALADAGMYGSAVLWFERSDDEAGFRRAAEYRDDVFASVTTHDLPTAAGFWRGEATRVRAELGLLGEGRTVEAQESDDARDRDQLRALLTAEGLAGADATEEELVLAMHTLLARTPSRLLAVALPDALGEHRQPNLPGTQDEYPNWRLPLATAPASAGAEPRPLLLDELPEHPGVLRLVGLLRSERPRTG